MSYQVIVTERAKADLRQIYNYIAVSLRSPQNAAGQLSRLEEEILSLDEMPERYRTYGGAKWNTRHLRVMPVDNYLVFYIPSREDKTVTVMRIVYGKRDLSSALSDYESYGDGSE